VQYLLSRGVDPNSADEGGNTPLHEVASALASSLAQSDGAYIEVAKLLIKAKAKVGAMDSAGSTPLHQAASLSSRDACERSASLAGLLVKAGAPVDGQDSDGETPLHHAAREDNADLVSLLLRNGADAKAKDKDGLTPLHWLGAFGQGCEPKVWARRWQTTIALLVGAGARLQDVDLAGRTPLWLATGRVFSQEIVKAFLAEGARAMDLGPRRASPLHFAAYLDEYGVAESLLGAGAAPTARDDSGLSPLHWAAVKGSNRTLALLLAKGADANTVDSSGRTPLDLAVLACQEKTVEVLRRAGGHTGRSDGHPLIPCPRPPPHAVDARLDKAASEDLQTVVRAGIPVDSRDHRGSTPLHLVARYSYLEADLRSLLGSKADPNARDDEGKTPLHFAAEDSREKISRLLLSAGADVNAKDVRGRTPLHMLQFRNDVQALTALLLQKGADPAVQDRLGRTALHAVSDTKDQRRDWVEYLMCHGGNPEVRDVLGWTVADLGAIRGWADTSPLHCSEAWQKADKPKSEPERPCLSY
jgi:cytohesin